MPESLLPDLWATPDAQTALRIAFAELDDDELQWYIQEAQTLRDAHAAKRDEWAAEQWSDLLALLCEARDARAAQAREIDDSVVFRISRIPDDNA